MSDFLTNLVSRVLTLDPAIRVDAPPLFVQDPPALSMQPNIGDLEAVVGAPAPPVSPLYGKSVPAAEAKSGIGTLSGRSDSGGERQMIGPSIETSDPNARTELQKIPSESGSRSTAMRPDITVSSHPQRVAGQRTQPAHENDPIPQSETRTIRPDIVASHEQTIPTRIVFDRQSQPALKTGPIPHPQSSVVQPATGDISPPPVPTQLVSVQHSQPAQEIDHASYARPTHQPALPAMRPAPIEASQVLSTQAESIATPPPAPVIRISIGRIDVSAVAPMAKVQNRAPAPQQSGVSLQDYLKQRSK